MITDKLQKLRFSLKEVVSFNIIYGLDTKPSNILDSFKSDENIVFLELVKIQPALYNVSYTNKPHERKTRGLIEGLKEFDLERGAILTKNYASKKIEDKSIEFLPLWAWLIMNGKVFFKETQP